MGEISIWVEVFLTLAILSFLYSDNPVYKFAEHLFVGTAVGYIIVIQFRQTVYPNLLNPLFINNVNASGEFLATRLLLLVPMLLGLLMFLQTSRRLAPFARMPMAVVIGSFSGLAVIGFAQGDLTQQIYANLVLPIIRPGAWTEFVENPGLFWFLELISNPILIFGLIAVLVYFYFSSKHEGVVGRIAKTGIYFLMISFGASYGYTVFTRLSLFYDRAILLAENGLVSILIGTMIVVCLVFLYFLNRKKIVPIPSKANLKGDS